MAGSADGVSADNQASRISAAQASAAQSTEPKTIKVDARDGEHRAILRKYGVIGLLRAHGLPVTRDAIRRTLARNGINDPRKIPPRELELVDVSSLDNGPVVVTVDASQGEARAALERGGVQALLEQQGMPADSEAVRAALAQNNRRNPRGFEPGKIKLVDLRGEARLVDEAPVPKPRALPEGGLAKAPPPVAPDADTKPAHQPTAGLEIAADLSVNARTGATGSVGKEEPRATVKAAALNPAETIGRALRDFPEYERRVRRGLDESSRFLRTPAYRVNGPNVPESTKTAVVTAQQQVHAAQQQIEAGKLDAAAKTLVQLRETLNTPIDGKGMGHVKDTLALIQRRLVKQIEPPAASHTVPDQVVALSARLFTSYGEQSQLLLDSVYADKYVDFSSDDLSFVRGTIRLRVGDAATGVLRINTALWTVARDLRNGTIGPEAFSRDGKPLTSWGEIDGRAIYDLATQRIANDEVDLGHEVDGMLRDPLWQSHRVVLNDPAKGPLELNPENFSALWQGTLVGAAKDDEKGWFFPGVFAPNETAEWLDGIGVVRTMASSAIHAAEAEKRPALARSEGLINTAYALFHGRGVDEARDDKDLLVGNASQATAALAEAAGVPIMDMELRPGARKDELELLQEKGKIAGFQQAYKNGPFIVFRMREPKEIAKDIQALVLDSLKGAGANDENPLEGLDQVAAQRALEMVGPPGDPGALIAERLEDAAEAAKWRGVSQVLVIGLVSAGAGAAVGGFTFGMTEALGVGGRGAVWLTSTAANAATFTTLSQAMNGQFDASRYPTDFAMFAVLSLAGPFGGLVGKTTGRTFARVGMQRVGQAAGYMAGAGGTVTAAATVMTGFEAMEAYARGHDIPNFKDKLVDNLKIVATLHVANGALARMGVHPGSAVHEEYQGLRARAQQQTREVAETWQKLQNVSIEADRIKELPRGHPDRARLAALTKQADGLLDRLTAQRKQADGLSAEVAAFAQRYMPRSEARQAGAQDFQQSRDSAEALSKATDLARQAGSNREAKLEVTTHRTANARAFTQRVEQVMRDVKRSDLPTNRKEALLERYQALKDNSIGFFDPISGRIYLNGGHVAKGGGEAVVRHEMTHARFAELQPKQQRRAVDTFRSNKAWKGDNGIRELYLREHPELRGMDSLALDTLITNEVLAEYHGRNFDAELTPLLAKAAPIIEGSQALRQLGLSKPPAPRKGYVNRSGERDIVGHGETSGPEIPSEGLFGGVELPPGMDAAEAYAKAAKAAGYRKIRPNQKLISTESAGPWDPSELSVFNEWARTAEPSQVQKALNWFAQYGEGAPGKFYQATGTEMPPYQAAARQRVRETAAPDPAKMTNGLQRPAGVSELQIPRLTRDVPPDKLLSPEVLEFWNYWVQTAPPKAAEKALSKLGFAYSQQYSSKKPLELGDPKVARAFDDSDVKAAFRQAKAGPTSFKEVLAELETNRNIASTNPTSDAAARALTDAKVTNLEQLSDRVAKDWDIRLEDMIDPSSAAVTARILELADAGKLRAVSDARQAVDIIGRLNRRVRTGTDKAAIDSARMTPEELRERFLLDQNDQPISMRPTLEILRSRSHEVIVAKELADWIEAAWSPVAKTPLTPDLAQALSRVSRAIELSHGNRPLESRVAARALELVTRPPREGGQSTAQELRVLAQRAEALATSELSAAKAEMVDAALDAAAKHRLAPEQFEGLLSNRELATALNEAGPEFIDVAFSRAAAGVEPGQITSELGLARRLCASGGPEIHRDIAVAMKNGNLVEMAGRTLREAYGWPADMVEALEGMDPASVDAIVANPAHARALGLAGDPTLSYSRAVNAVAAKATADPTFLTNEGRKLAIPKQLERDIAAAQETGGPPSPEALAKQVELARNAEVSKVRGSQPWPPGSDAQTGHGYGKHLADPALSVDIINNAENVFTGVNSRGRPVTVFHRGGDVAITQADDITRVITTYGESTVTKAKGGKVKPGDAVTASRWSDESNWKDGEYWERVK